MLVRTTVCFALLVSLILSTLPLSAYAVTMDYPGFFSKDTDLPGIPGDSNTEYKEELVRWGKEAGYSLMSRRMAEVMANKPFDAGINAPLIMVSGGTQHKPFNPDWKIWVAMRDILFLESMQKSIQTWNQEYIQPMATNGNLSDAYTRAKTIGDRYEEYLRIVGTDGHNPIVSFLMTGFKGAFPEFFINNGLPPGTGTALTSFRTNLINNANTNFTAILNDPVKNVAVTLGESLRGIGKDAIFAEIASAIGQDNPELGQNLLNGYAAYSAGTEILSTGGVGAVTILAPAQIIQGSLLHIANGFLNASLGAHMILDYYYNKKWVDEFKTYARTNPNGSINFLDFKMYFSQENPGLIEDDPIARNLANHNYTFNDSATYEQAAAVYSLSSIFRMVETLDIQKAKENLVAFAILSYVAENGFVLDFTTDSPNIYTLTVPDAIFTPGDHGSISNIVWRANASVITKDTTWATGSQTREGKLQSLTLDVSSMAEPKSQTVEVIITYEDGHELVGSQELEYMPNHPNITLSGETTLNTDSEVSFTASIDGDQYESLFVHLGDSVIKPQITHGEGTQYTITFDISRTAKTGPMALYLEVDAQQSNTLTVNVVNALDTDGDHLRDTWEMEHFGNLDQGPGDDPDNDGMSNIAEYTYRTDPMIAGLAGVTEELIFEPYVDPKTGDTINFFEIQGDIFGHVTVKGGACISAPKDIDLVIHGNLLLEDGSLSSSEGTGKLAVLGDFLAGKGFMQRGHSVSIGGDFIHEYGQLNINAPFEVKGDFRAQKKTNDQWTEADVRLRLTDDTAHLLVHGDMHIQGKTGTRDEPYRFDKGTIELKGNLYTYGTIGWQYTSYLWTPKYNNSRHFILSGDTPQTVTLVYSLNLNHIELKNTSEEGIAFSDKWISTNFIEFNNTATTGLRLRGARNSDDSFLTKDDTVRGNIEFDYLLLDGHDFHVKGNFTVKKCFAKSSKLTVDGNCIHSVAINDYGSFRVDSTVEVKGDFRAQYFEDGHWDYSAGWFEMNEETGHLLIWGDVYTDARKPSILGQQQGIIELKGNLYTFDQTNGHIDYFSTDHSTATRTLLLSGTSQQTLNLKNTLKIKNLKLKNSSSDGVLIMGNGPLDVYGLFSHNCTPINMLASATFIDSDNDGHKDNEDAFPNDNTKWEAEGVCLAVDPDSDDDGLLDADEIKYFTNLAQTPDGDFDNDGMSNKRELDHNLNPKVNDAGLDPDNDGFSNQQELDGGFDPNDATSHPPITTNSVNLTPIIQLLLN